MHWCNILVIVVSVAGIVVAQDDCDPGVDHTSRCQDPGSPHNYICSGRGSCQCGECWCNKRPNPYESISGRYCQCTNFLCAAMNGQLCGGPERGTCECDECQCRPGYYGDACEYDNRQDNCINPGTGDICSGNGNCENNQCRCYETEEGSYTGKWCGDCPTCAGKCMTYKPCVQCLVFGTGDWSSRNCRNNCRTLKKRTSVVSHLEVLENERLCTFFDENDCRFTFAYGYNNNQHPVIRVKKTMDCPPKPDIIDDTGDQLNEVSNLLGAFYGFAKDVVDNTFVKFYNDMSLHLRRW